LLLADHLLPIFDIAVRYVNRVTLHHGAGISQSTHFLSPAEDDLAYQREQEIGDERDSGFGQGIQDSACTRPFSLVKRPIVMIVVDQNP
jgi:hypothetical protein